MTGDGYPTLNETDGNDLGNKTSKLAADVLTILALLTADMEKEVADATYYVVFALLGNLTRAAYFTGKAHAERDLMSVPPGTMLN
ncbi:MAG: hypothetical protein KGL39_42615 [Patescibacteria group bacterium]|nr:hypothetical protein [Patescibacteria group bacterium]